MINFAKIDDILKDREEKVLFINKLSTKNICLAVKANIPGIDKNVYQANLIIKYFENKIELLYNQLIKDKFSLIGSDGQMIIYQLELESTLENATDIKKQTICFEEDEEIGRLIDIDVYYGDKVSMRRPQLRKCLLCSNEAFYCNRQRSHSYDELFKAINRIINQTYQSIVSSMIEESMSRELNLHPKFGLVTPYTSGSHLDMDYNLMEQSIKILKKPLWLMFNEGFNCNDLNLLFDKIRCIGQQAEVEMFENSNGVNTYKGLIFGLGIVVASSGYLLKNHYQNYEVLFEIIKKITKNLKKELDDMSNQDNLSFGLIAYQKYQIGGARLEAYNGFQSVRKKELKDLSNSSLLEALVDLIIEADDTTLLKRAKSYERYLDIKEKFKKLDLNNEKEITNLNEYCLSNNLSFGGAADLLIIKIYLFLFKNYFFKEGGKNEK